MWTPKNVCVEYFQALALIIMKPSDKQIFVMSNWNLIFFSLFFEFFSLSENFDSKMIIPFNLIGLIDTVNGSSCLFLKIVGVMTLRDKFSRRFAW